MSLSTTTYTTTSGRSNYRSDFEPASESHLNVILSVAGVESVVNVTDYDYINSSVVFHEGKEPLAGNTLYVNVASTPDELLESPTDIGALAGLTTEIDALASIADDIESLGPLAPNITEITSEPLKTAILDAEANATQVQSNLCSTNYNALLAEASARNAKTYAYELAPNDGITVWIVQDTGATDANGCTIYSLVSDTSLDYSSSATYMFKTKAILDEFKGTYYGTYASDPLVDPLGAPVGSGDMYFNTTDSKLKVYDGTTWQNSTSTLTETSVSTLTNKTIDFDSNTIVNNIDDVVAQTTKPYSGSKVQELHDAQAHAIANLATAQGEIHNTSKPSVSPITTTPSVLDFIIGQDTTNSEVFTFDATNNTITFLQNASYNFNSIIEVHSNTSSTETITFNLVDVSDDSVVVTQSHDVAISNNKTAILPVNTLVTVGIGGVPVSPLTIRVEVLSTGSGYELSTFTSILASSASYDATNVDTIDTALGNKLTEDISTWI